MSKLTKEQKRKRKKNRKILARKRRKIILAKKRTKVKPWEPVKMKFFEVPNIFRENVSREERLNVLKDIGKKVTEEFNIKYPSIQKWFENYDSLYILSFLFFYFLAYPEGTDPETEGKLEIYHHYLELMQAFSLYQNRNFSPKPLLENAEILKKDLMEIGRLMQLRHLNALGNIKSNEDVHQLYLRNSIMANTVAVRNWAYPHQMRKVVSDLAKNVKDEYEKRYSIDLSRAMNMLFELIDKCEDLMSLHFNRLRSFAKINSYKEMLDAYSNTFPETVKMNDSEKDELWKRSGKNLKRLTYMLICHADLRLEKIYTFSLDQAVSLYGDDSKRDKIKELLGKWSYKFGDLKNENFDKEHLILANPIHLRPFIDLGEGKYYSAIFGILAHLSIGLLENLIFEDKIIKMKYCDEIKPQYLENEVERLFRLHFPNAKVCRGSEWVDPLSNVQYENDLTILIDTFAIVVEAKSAQVTPPAKRGAPNRLFETLGELVEKPAEQAHRFISFLKNNKSVHIFKNKRGEENIIDSSEINYYIPIGVTLAHLGSISSNLKKIINAGITKKKIGDLAPSISLTDIELIFELLPLEAEKIHYFARRREIEDHLDYEGDEMDLLSFYLDNGFNIGASEYEGSIALCLLLKSKELDPYFVGRNRGIGVVKPELNLTTWWKDILEQLHNRKPQNWIETSFILLNSTKEDQENFIKALEELKQRIRAGRVEKKHNWVNFLSGPERRRFSIVGYPYTIESKEERNNMIATILEQESENKIRGAVVIGININKSDYPYSVLAGKLDTDLFDDLRSVEDGQVSNQKVD